MIQPFWMTMVFNFFASIPWTFIFFVTQFFGIRLYYIRNREECKRIQKRIGKYSSHTTDGGQGYGYSIGCWYVASIQSTNCSDYTATIIATESSYRNLISNHEIPGNSHDGDDAEEDNHIHIHERCGSFGNYWFRERRVQFAMTPRPEQQEIIDKIKAHYEEHNHTVVLLHGKPGQGKSIIGLFLTNDYKSHYCNSLRPWQPGDTLADIVGDIEPTKDKPLILMFDEFDGVIQRIHHGIAPHQELPISVPDKTGWNKMLDDIQLGLYPCLILIMTSNSAIDFFNELDASYLRHGRVDLIFSM